MTLTNRAVKQLKESDYNYMLLIREFSAHSNFCNNYIKKDFITNKRKKFRALPLPRSEPFKGYSLNYLDFSSFFKVFFEKSLRDSD